MASVSVITAKKMRVCSDTGMPSRTSTLRSDSKIFSAECSPGNESTPTMCDDTSKSGVVPVISKISYLSKLYLELMPSVSRLGSVVNGFGFVGGGADLDDAGFDADSADTDANAAGADADTTPGSITYGTRHESFIMLRVSVMMRAASLRMSRPRVEHEYTWMLGAMYVMSSLTGPSTQSSANLNSAVIRVISWRRPASVTRRVTGSIASSASPDGSLSNLRALVFHSAIFSSRGTRGQSMRCVSNQWFIGLRVAKRLCVLYDGGDTWLACRQTYDLPSGSNLKHASHGGGASVLSFFLKIGATAIPAR